MPSRGRFVGRTDQLATFAERLASARGGRGAALFVRGEAGIGKSRLLDEFRLAAEHAGARVVLGACPRLDTPLPYSGLAEPARQLAEARHSDALPASNWALSVVGAMATDHDDDVPDDASLRQLQVFEGLLGAFRAASSAEEPLVAFVDDLQWADPSTRDFVAFVVPRLVTEPIVFVGALRTDDAARDGGGRWLREMARYDHVELQTLGRLDEQDVRSLVSEVGLGPDASSAVLAKSGGNPLFALEIADALRERRPLAASVVDFLVERLERLGNESRAVVGIAAALGADGDLHVLELAARMPPAVSSDAIRGAQKVGILRVEGSRYSFEHPLLRDLAYDRLMPAERGAIHRAIAEMLQHPMVAAQSLGLRRIQIARHWYEAGDPEHAYPALLDAAEAAGTMYAFREALHFYDLAFQIEPQHGQSPQSRIGFRMPQPETHSASRPRLRQRAAQVASLAGDPKRAQDLARSALDESDGELRLVLQENLGRYLWEDGAAAEGLDLLGTALEATNGVESPGRLRLLTSYAGALLLSGDADRALPLAVQAIESAQRLGDGEAEWQARVVHGACATAKGDTVAGLNALERARQERLATKKQGTLAPRVSRLADVLGAYVADAAALRKTGQGARSLEVAVRGLDEAKQYGVAAIWTSLLATLASIEMYELGRWDDALALVTDATGQTGSTSADLRHVAARIYLWRGDAAAAIALLHGLEPTHATSEPARAFVLACQAEIAAATDDLEIVIDQCIDGISVMEAAGDEEAQCELAIIGLRAAAERGGAPIGRSRRSGVTELEADVLLLQAKVQALPVGDADSGTAKLAAFAAWGRGEIARFRGEADSATWAEAMRLFNQLSSPHRAAYCQFRLAEALLASRRNRAAAADHLRLALRESRALQAKSLIAAIVQVMQAARISQETGSAGDRPERSEDSLGLSARELEVLQELSVGRTNKEIARVLFITEKTAGHHVSAILGKLGVRSRVEAVAVGLRAGLVLEVGGGQHATSEADERERGELTLTMMFTDIVSSTKLVNAIGDEAWATLLAWHDVTLRRLFNEHDGREVDHPGDGFFVVFRFTSQAIDCAIAIQRTLHAHRAAQGFSPSVRIGLHTAAVVAQESAFRGRGVHEAARVAQAASGEEILISASSLGGLARRVPVGAARSIEAAGLTEPMEVTTIEWRIEN